MATTNGAATPPQPLDLTTTTTTSATTDSSANKRKRIDDDDDAPTTSTASHRISQTQRDLLEILQQWDITPSFLQYELRSDASSHQPAQKKARVEEDGGKETISSKLRHGAYATLDALVNDAARVSKDIETTLRTGAQGRGGQDAGRLSVEELKQIQRAKNFELLVKDVVEKETQYDAQGKVKKESTNTANGLETRAGARNDGSSTVLTLFGNAPTPKQLFSSMQHAPPSRTDRLVKNELPVEEMSLPNGLTATKIMPGSTEPTKKAPTFEEAFAPAHSLPALHPPKSHKRSSTRDTTIKWEFKDSTHRGSKKGGYTVQTLTEGSWLGYGGLDSAQGLLSSKEKRKQRERALSSGTESAKEPPSKAALQEEQARYEEALFRRAYSSFAPSHDNAKSIIPAQTKANIWWERSGEKRFNETFAIDPALLSEQPAPADNDSTTEIPADEEAFGNVVDELLEHDKSLGDVKPVTSKHDVEQVLRDVSELIETLASHQRIRNASLQHSTSTSRTPVSPAPALASKIGKPDEPAEEEVSTYHSLQRELAYLILKLPPYAVAKLDGEQLAELGVSKLIPFVSKDTKGILEEDQVSRLAKYTAMQTAAGIATLTRGTSSSSGQHYNTTAQRTPAIGQAANTRYGQQSYTAPRPVAQPQFQRSTSGQPNYGTPTTTTASTHRAASGYGGQAATQYSRPTSTYGGQSNGTAPQQYYQPRPAPAQAAPGYAGGYTNQQYAGTAPQRTYTPSAASSQPLQQFQQRAAQFQGTPTYGRTASPVKYAVPQQQVPRPGFPPGGSGSGRVTPVGGVGGVNGFQQPQRPSPGLISAAAVGGTGQGQMQGGGGANGHV